MANFKGGGNKAALAINIADYLASQRLSHLITSWNCLFITLYKFNRTLIECLALLRLSYIKEGRAMAKASNPAYLAKVKKLTKEETERLLSRMSGKLPRRLAKDKLTKEEALALQMEVEDEQLQEWRKMMQALRKKEAEKKAGAKPGSTKAVKTQATPQVKEKANAPAKRKAAKKSKTSPKTNVAE
jgi:hypothetical protein